MGNIFAKYTLLVFLFVLYLPALCKISLFSFKFGLIVHICLALYENVNIELVLAEILLIKVNIKFLFLLNIHFSFK